MPARSRIYWAAVNWHQDNTTIARELGMSPWTVIERRREYAPDTQGLYRKVRKDREKMVERGRKLGRATTPERQAHATQKAKESPKSGKFVSNVHAKEWTLISPEDKVHHVRNLHQFVRENPDLFDERDRTWKRNGSREYCNATAGIQNLRAGKAESWKGWQCVPERGQESTETQKK